MESEKYVRKMNACLRLQFRLAVIFDVNAWEIVKM